jgi:hypothetical protein
VRKEENSGTGTEREGVVVVGGDVNADADTGVVGLVMVDAAGRGVIASGSAWFWWTGAVGAEEENDDSRSWS